MNHVSIHVVGDPGRVRSNCAQFIKASLAGTAHEAASVSERDKAKPPSTRGVEPVARMHVTNLRCALAAAIQQAEATGLGNSAQCAGFRANYAALMADQRLEIVYE